MKCELFMDLNNIHITYGCHNKHNQYTTPYTSLPLMYAQRNLSVDQGATNWRHGSWNKMWLSFIILISPFNNQLDSYLNKFKSNWLCGIYYQRYICMYYFVHLSPCLTQFSLYILTFYISPFTLPPLGVYRHKIAYLS